LPTYTPPSITPSAIDVDNVSDSNIDKVSVIDINICNCLGCPFIVPTCTNNCVWAIATDDQLLDFFVSDVAKKQGSFLMNDMQRTFAFNDDFIKTTTTCFDRSQPTSTVWGYHVYAYILGATPNPISTTPSFNERISTSPSSAILKRLISSLLK
jgi:hypothetical protein